MADVPDINPIRPIWPTRSDEKSNKRRRPDDDERNDERKKQKKDEGNNKGPGEGHVDEYV